jgi:hypothetical protein
VAFGLERIKPHGQGLDLRGIESAACWRGAISRPDGRVASLVPRWQVRVLLPDTGRTAIRNHVWLRDVTLGEDALRIRKTPGAFTRMRCFAYNILRINQSGTTAQDRYAVALGGLKSIFSMRFSKER